MRQQAFQFHKGTIKTTLTIKTRLRRIYFNSIKVRLKLILIIFLQLVLKFQFHKGTIKTRERNNSAVVRHPFQFHKGTIKTAGEKWKTNSNYNFNSIKVRLKL